MAGVASVIRNFSPLDRMGYFLAIQFPHPSKKPGLREKQSSAQNAKHIMRSFSPYDTGLNSFKCLLTIFLIISFRLSASILSPSSCFYIQKIEMNEWSINAFITVEQ